MKIDEFDTAIPFTPLSATDLTRLMLVGFDLTVSAPVVAAIIKFVNRGLSLIDKTRGLSLK